MTVEFRLPNLGENITAADVVDILVAVGDRVEVDQSVIEAETDKAVMEIPVSVAGVVTEIRAQKGASINIGDVVLLIDETAAAAAETTPAASPAPEAAQPKAPPPDDRPAEEPPASTAAPAPMAPAKPETKSAEQAPATAERLPVSAAPSVRQFARDLGVDIQQVTGTGAGGRISIDDVKMLARSRLSGQGPVEPAAGKPKIVREKMSKVRKVTAERMAESWSTIPHVTITNSADITNLELIRQKSKAMAEKAGGRLTITAILTKIAASALKIFPAINASLDMQAQEIEYRHYYNIGIAADTERGLVVPVVRDADKKSILELAIEITELSNKARDGKLMPDDMSGGTFTITNLGSLGVQEFTPIVFAPQVAILGVGCASKQPVWRNERFDPRLILPLSLSFDHRLIDGAEAARFLQWIVAAAQNPLMLSLEG